MSIVSKTISEYLNVTITDLNGKIVMHKKNLATKDFISNFELNLTPGFYTVVIRNSADEISVKKLVVAE